MQRSFMLDFILTNVVFNTSKNLILARYVIAQECPHSYVQQMDTFNKQIFPWKLFIY